MQVSLWDSPKTETNVNTFSLCSLKQKLKISQIQDKLKTHGTGDCLEARIHLHHFNVIYFLFLSGTLDFWSRKLLFYILFLLPYFMRKMQ